ncbi:MAG: hypothetical protein GX886_17245 [Comamonadaceae bacterium]|nr:hypothetical protein [Comamonadaceae bacterium]
MLNCLARRLLATLGILLLVSLLVFLMLRLTPGDTAMALAGETASPEQVDRVNEAMGLDRPLPTQYLLWVAHLTLGDLGRSAQADAPVGKVVAQRLGTSLGLLVPAGALALLLALPLGVLAAWRHGGWLDRAVAALAPAAAPTIWEQNTHPNTTPERSAPYRWRHNATVGGTVATQSRP